MKTIYFIRHAKSEQNIGCDDVDRLLNTRGEKDALFMAERLEKYYNAKADIIISSHTKRALMTAKIIAENFKTADFKIEKKLYLTSFTTYISIISTLQDTYKDVFIVGHNPTITDICENLSGEFIGNIPTCGIFCMQFDMESFKDISTAKGKKVFFDSPNK